MSAPGATFTWLRHNLLTQIGIRIKPAAQACCELQRRKWKQGGADT